MTAEWIAVDWGTSRLRAWAMAGASVLEAAHSDRGMGTLTKEAFEPALLELVSPWLGSGTTPVLACGMVGARQGWVEAPYSSVPIAPLSADFARPTTHDPRLSVFVVPGLKQGRPADVMRGEEVQIAGFLAHNPTFDGTLCLPGTHTKWVQISAGEVVSFQTVMTGELYALLSRQSVLRHSVGDTGEDSAAFVDAVRDTLAHPERLAQRLFGIRAESLIASLAADTAAARLSGLLIGAELAATRARWLGLPVGLVGDSALCRRYAEALAQQGASVEIADGNAMTLAGLGAARAALGERAS